MQIPKSFEDALFRAYNDRSELLKLFTEQRSFIEKLARWSLRGNHWGIISDQDDLYQEACIWIIDSLWRWDDKVGTPLGRYVVYNVGARLRNVVAKETTSKRRPKKPSISLNKKVYEDSSDSMTIQDCIPSNEPSSEERVAFEEALRCVDKELPFLAKMLLNYLIEEEGNFSAAAARLKTKIKGIGNVSDSAFRMTLRRNVIPEIHSVLVEKNLLPESGKKKIVENFVQSLLLST